MTASRRQYEKNCVICGKVFHPFRKSNETCSCHCSQMLRNKRKGQERIEVKCSQCGKPFKVMPNIFKKNKNNYCSVTCYWIHKKQLTKGKNNSNFHNGGYNRICLTCGKGFFTYNKKKKYCSSRCVKRINLLRRGRNFEWKARDELRKEGFLVVRSAGSKTAIDLVAFKLNETKLIQVKATMNKTTKVLRLFKKDVNYLKNVECEPTLKKELWVWRNRKGWIKITI